MAPVKRLQFLISLIYTLAIARLYPQALINESAFATFLSLLSFEFTVYFIWTVILYPKYFSSLRHLPAPKVSLRIYLHT